MLWLNIKRVVRGGFTSFIRNGLISLSSILVMTVTLFVIGSVIFLLAMLNASLNDLKGRVDINVYMMTDASEPDILALQSALEGLPEVKSVQYISADQELANFKERHANDQPTLDALNEISGNPLGAVLNVTAKDPSQYEAIAQFLQSGSALSKDQQVIVSKVNYQDNETAISVLSKIITSAKRLGFALAAVLVVISVLIIFNTIRLAIYNSREEIAVMRLVGASSKYVRGPFVIVGVLYGVVAGLLTTAIFYPLTYWLGTATANFFSGINVFNYYTQNFGQIFTVIVGSGVILGAAASYWSVRRYLKI